MKPMTGEIGKLSLNGEQVGGFKYWTAIRNRTTGQTRVRASRFWLLREVEANTFNAEFYVNTNEGLECVYSTEVTAALPQSTVNKMVDKVIEMNLGTFDWVQGVT